MQDKIDLAGLEVDAHQLHRHAVGEAVALAGALAEELVARGVELEVVAAELGDVHQAVDEVVVERDEKAERHDAGDAAREGAADVVAHVVALEPVLDVAARVVGAPLGLGAVAAQRFPVVFDIGFVGKHRFDGAVHEEIRVAADRRGEVHVGVEREAEVADVARAVHRLLQRAQQDRLQQAEVGPLADALEQLRVVLAAAGSRRREARVRARRGTRAAPPPCRRPARRARGRAPAACGRRGSCRRRRSPRACTPR